jgi:hypothetical protein
MTKSVAKKQEAVPAFLKDAMNDNRGNENVGQDDLIIPRLCIIQALSPEIKKKDPAYIEGAEQGMLFNSVSRKLYGNSVTVIPVMYEKPYLLWKDRKLGGGFGGSFKTMAEANEAIVALPANEQDGWEAVDTPTHLCLLVDEGFQEIAIPMPKSKAKVSRQWNSMIRMMGGPRFSHKFIIEGVEAENNAGEEIWNFKVTPAGFVTVDEFRQGEVVYDLLTKGEYTIQQE